MIVTCWSVKGGSGTTVVASCLGLAMVRRVQNDVLLVDLAGDVPAVLGLDAPTPEGVLDWIQTTTEAGGFASGSAGLPGALAALEMRVDERLSILPWGSSRSAVASLNALTPLLKRLHADGRTVIVDAGTVSPACDDGIRHRFVRAADTSLLVTRACYLSMRHAACSSLQPDGVIVVSEPGRALGADDVASVTGAPVVAELKCEPQIARIVDAGLLCARLPRSVERAFIDVCEVAA